MCSLKSLVLVMIVISTQAVASDVSVMLLMPWNKTASFRNLALHETIVEEGMAHSLRSDLENRYSKFEYKKNYGLTNSDDDREFIDSQNKWSVQAVTQVQNYHIQTTGRTIAQVHKNDPIIKSVKKPVMYAAVAAAIYFGYPIDVFKDEKSKVELRTEAANRRAQVSYMSNQMDASLGVAAKDAGGSQEALRLPDRPSALPGNEVARVGASRGLGLWDMKAGVGYGVSTTTASQSLMKPITRNLSLALERAQVLRGSSDTLKSNETVRLNYGINF